MKLRTLSFLLLAASIIGCTNNSNSSGESKADTSTTVKTHNITSGDVKITDDDSSTITWFAAGDENQTGKRPLVFVVHEWWGLNDYAKSRAKQIAELGYYAIAVDMYGDGKVARTPDEAKGLAMPFYKDPALAVTRLKGVWNKTIRNPLVDSTRIAGIGYCFGGGMLLNAAKMGMPFTGVVSFHGSLAGVPPKAPMKTKFLICHGQVDKTVSPQDVAIFKKQMDSVGADYVFKEYAGATHAFTNPASTETGRKFNMPIEYNAAADTAS
jgi:dienelactone hydrolase